MKIAAMPLAGAFSLVGGLALGQGRDDPMAHLRACALMEGPARLECLEHPSRNIAPSARPTSTADNWIVSETRSPVDYTPVVVATALSRDSLDGSSVQLSINCRAGRTEMILSGPAISRSSNDPLISYRINNDPPAQFAVALPTSGAGIAFKGDVVSWLQALPEEGELAIRVASRAGGNQEVHFWLGGLRTVREKMIAACKWPHSVGRPRN
jgi:hypothetical protein